MHDQQWILYKQIRSLSQKYDPYYVTYSSFLPMGDYFLQSIFHCFIQQRFKQISK